MTPEPSEIGSALQQVTELSQKIIHEEIELAKAEVAEKVSKLARGAAIGAAAGVFVLAGLIYFLHALSWFVWKLIRGDSTSTGGAPSTQTALITTRPLGYHAVPATQPAPAELGSVTAHDPQYSMGLSLSAKGAAAA